MKLILALISCAAAETLTSFDGELTDVAKLAQPALDDGLIKSVNADASLNWQAGRNPRFEGATLADVKALCGTKSNTDKKSFLPYKPLAKVADLPTEFDWRTDPRAASCPSIKEIRDQANCGSCWAFGSVEAMTDRICIASNGTKTDHLSAQDVTSCCGGLSGDMGCNGGVPSTVYTYYKNTGIVTGGNYGDASGCYSYQLAPCAHHINGSKYPACPDSVPTPKCARSCTDSKAVGWLADKRHGAEGGYSVCQQGMSNGACADQMAQEIYQNGPITGMFFVHQSFTSYTSGVYKKKLLNDPMLGGHAIKIMGFGTENGEDYWLVANSWNEDWGMDGYFKIKRGTNECQIEDAIINGGPVAGMPKL